MPDLDPLGPFADSALCMASAAWLGTLSNPPMAQHCRRSPRFGLVLGDLVEAALFDG